MMLRLPGSRIHHCGLDQDPERLAAWLLALVDESPDKLAIVKVPPVESESEIDAVEAKFIGAYDIAKARRPHLSVKLLQTFDIYCGRPRPRIALAVHEHRWVGGRCVNGCPDSRPTTAEEN